MFIMQFNEKFIYIVSKNRHMCYILPFFRTLFICLFYSYFLFLFKKAISPMKMFFTSSSD